MIEYLGYKRRNFSIVDILINCGSLKGQDVYPCVVKALGLKQYETKYYPDRYTKKYLLLSIEEYIRGLISDIRKRRKDIEE